MSGPIYFTCRSNLTSVISTFWAETLSKDKGTVVSLATCTSNFVKGSTKHHIDVFSFQKANFYLFENKHFKYLEEYNYKIAEMKYTHKLPLKDDN